MKQFLSLFLVLSMLFSAAACSTAPAKDDTAEDTGKDAVLEEKNESAEEITTELDDSPELPETDMQGKTFMILNTHWCDVKSIDLPDLLAEETNGEIMNDNTYARNLHMDETFNCVIDSNRVANGAEITALTQMKSAGDTTYDFAFIRGNEFSSIITQGLVRDLTDVPVVNYENPWWDQKSFEQLSVLGHHFGVTSDLTVGDEMTAWVLFFNKGLIDEFNLESPYELVKNNEWVYEKFFAMAAVVAEDLNGDGVRDEEDRYGITHTRDTTVGMFNSSGVHFAKVNEEGIPEITCTDEESVTKMIYLLEGLYKQDVCFNAHIRSVKTNTGTMFKNNQVLFMMSNIYNTVNLRDMEDDFGMLPYPKYDLNQTEYDTATSGLFLPLMVVPSMVENEEWLGIFLEEYAWYGYKVIRPGFYETLLQRKVARDAESLEMLDFIFDNLIYDWGNVTNIGNLSYDIIFLQNSYNSNVASFLKGREKRNQKSINQMLEAIENLD